MQKLKRSPCCGNPGGGINRSYVEEYLGREGGRKMWRLYYVCLGAFPASLFFIIVSVSGGIGVFWPLGMLGVLSGVGLLTLKSVVRRKEGESEAKRYIHL